MGADGWYLLTELDGDVASSLARAQRRGARVDASTVQSTENKAQAALQAIDGIGPVPGFLVAGPFEGDHLVEMLGTARPTRADVLSRVDALLEFLDRGEACYVLVYEGEAPNEVLFAGYSCD